MLPKASAWGYLLDLKMEAKGCFSTSEGRDASPFEQKEAHTTEKLLFKAAAQ